MILPRVSGEDWKYIIRLILTAFDKNLTVADNFIPGDVEAVAEAVADGQIASMTLTLGDYTTDAAAKVGGVAIGGLYRNGNVVQIRLI